MPMSDEAVFDRDTTCRAQGRTQRWPSVPTVPPVALRGQKAGGGAGARELIPTPVGLRGSILSWLSQMPPSLPYTCPLEALWQGSG